LTICSKYRYNKPEEGDIC